MSLIDLTEHVLADLSLQGGLEKRREEMAIEQAVLVHITYDETNMTSTTFAVLRLSMYVIMNENLKS